MNDVDFELELIHRDEINVLYILQLLGELQQTNDKAEKQRQQKNIIDLLTGDTQLRSKRTLIEKFIHKNLPNIKDTNTIPEEFKTFWNTEQKAAFERLCKEEHLQSTNLLKLIEDYQYTGRAPINDDIINVLNFKPKVRERKSIRQRVKAKILDFVALFMEGLE